MRWHLDRIVFAIFAMTLATGSWSCSRQPEEPAPAAASGRSKITLNFNPTMTYSPLMIARDEGYFDEEGIDVEMVSLDSNSALAALVAGKIDVLSSGVRSGVFNMIQRGETLQVVAGKGNQGDSCSPEAFIAPTAMAQRIAAAGGNLRGERVAIIRGGITEYLVEQLLAHQNLSVADVVAISMPHGAPASSRDKLEAVRYIGEPNLSLLLTEGSMSVVSTADQVAPRHQSTFVVYGKRLLQDDPELGRRFMRAYLRAVRQFNSGKSDRNVEILSRHTKLPPEILRQSCWTVTNDDSRLDKRDVQPFLDWALKKGYLDGPMTVEWWNPSFIDYASSSLAASSP